MILELLICDPRDSESEDNKSRNKQDFRLPEYFDNNFSNNIYVW